MSHQEIDIATLTKLRESGSGNLVPKGGVVAEYSNKASTAPEVPTYDCVHCGHCENPQYCVWGVTCPRCDAAPVTQCMEQGGRLVGLHPERWTYAKTTANAPS